MERTIKEPVPRYSQAALDIADQVWRDLLCKLIANDYEAIREAVQRGINHGAALGRLPEAASERRMSRAGKLLEAASDAEAAAKQIP